MPWIDQVTGASKSGIPESAAEVALANILFGDVNPTGKLPVSFAKSDGDLHIRKFPAWR
ncbi:MAG: glycoside hydrolase family 3 C-terminal domain-containing protein [Ignavibacteriota bacterium]